MFLILTLFWTISFRYVLWAVVQGELVVSQRNISDFIIINEKLKKYFQAVKKVCMFDFVKKKHYCLINIYLMLCLWHDLNIHCGDLWQQIQLNSCIHKQVCIVKMKEENSLEFVQCVDVNNIKYMYFCVKKHVNNSTKTFFLIVHLKLLILKHLYDC